MINLQHLRGKKVSRIRRIYYIHQNAVETHEGAFELCFQDGSFLLLDTHADWTLHAEQAEWSDAFTPPRTTKNSDYVRDYGKWSAFDRSHTIPAHLLLDRTVSAFQEIKNETGQIMGAILEFDELTVKVYSYEGEIRVEWNGPGFTFCDIPHVLALGSKMEK